MAVALGASYLGVEALKAIPKTNPHQIYNLTLVVVALFGCVFLGLARMWRNHRHPSNA